MPLFPHKSRPSERIILGIMVNPKKLRLNRARQHRERQAAEEQQRRQQAAAQLAAQLAAKRAREERMRAPEQVGRKMVLGAESL